MSELQLLSKLSAWYSERCDGFWEHAYGIHVTTLDNPGWMLEVDLRGTPLENAEFEAVDLGKDESDWVNCYKKDGKFVGAGDPSKLALIIEVFLKFVGKL